MGPLTDTIAAPATPEGSSALAVIRISGKDTERLAAAIFASPTPPPRTAQLADYRAGDGSALDQVLCTHFPAPHSYTGEDVLEISCHGNPFIVQRILQDLYARGCRPAEPGEFTLRAFLHRRIDLSQAEAVMDVIRARSERALAAAQRQLRGGLGRQLQALAARLTEVLATVEAGIDFPEEDVPEEDRSALARSLEAIQAETGQWLATRRAGDLLREGIRTVLVGGPNAGKSSLLNRLVGRERALVSPEPGTTRDFIEEAAAIGPHAFRLIDTAGLNPAAGELESRGMALTRQCIEDSDIVILVLDATRPTLPGGLDGALVPGRALVALNKIDLRPAEAASRPVSGLVTVPVSALTGAGLEELKRALVRQADSLSVNPAGEGVAINARHAEALGRARESLARALQNLAAAGPAELLASDLREALEALGDISGRYDNERMLDRLFASFCIGK
jgi:tRNA modification GTPase